MKLAMLNIHRRLSAATGAVSQFRSRMLLQIHDELIFEVPPDELDVMRQLVRDEMSGIMPLAVPLKIDLKTGHNWAQCE